MDKKFVIIFTFVATVLYACNNGPAETDNLENLVNDLAEEQSDEVSDDAANSKNYSEMIIGKWDYVETITTVGDMEVNVKAMESWTMEYRKDLTFHEVSVLDKEYILDDSYTIEDNVLRRKGAIEVTIDELTSDKLVIGSLGSKMVFKRVN